MIKISGNIFGTQGYSIHTRSLANAINEIEPVNLATGLVQNWEMQVTDSELEMIKRDEECSTNIIISTPQFWNVYLDHKAKNIGFLVFEGDKMPKSWVKECANPKIDMIFVPSEHTKMAIQNALKDTNSAAQIYIEDKIRIIPHGIDPTLFKPANVTKPEVFRFFCNKGFRGVEDRGGIQYAIQAFMQEFKQEEKVELVIKINPAYGVPDLKKIMEELGFDEKKNPAVIFILEDRPYDKMPELYQQLDVFLAPTRAEAFNIPCLEAMACGIPVITTDFGGQTDYVPAEWCVSGVLGAVQHEIMYEETKWLTPNIDKLRKMMRKFYNNPPKVPDISKYTWETSAKKAITEIQTFK